MERDNKHIYETLKKVGAVVATGALIYESSKWALTISARKEAGKRDSWACMGVDGEECYQKTVTDEEISFRNGYMVTLAHYKTTQHLTGKGYHDPNPENARCLCGVCHATEEVDMNNNWGAQKLLDFGNYTSNSVRDEERSQQYMTVEQALEIREKARDITLQLQIGEDKEESKKRVEELKMLLGSGNRRRV